MRALRRILVAWLPALIIAGFVAVMFWRLWTPIDGARRVLGWDAVWQYWGDLDYAVDAVRDGELPLWNPFDRGGYPIHADPQAGLLYPINWVLVGLGAIFGAGQWLIALKAVLHFTLLGVGVYYLLRRRGTGLPAIAVAIGMTLFIHPFGTYLFSALLWGMAWWPWLLIAIERIVERPTIGRGAGLAVVAGLCVLAGAPASSWYCALIAIPYGALLVVQRVRASERSARRALWIDLGKAAGVAVGLVVAMIAGQTIATGALVDQTVRASRTLDFIGGPGIGADDLVGMAVPRLPTDPSLYLGVAAVLWIGIAMTLHLSVRNLVLGGIAVLGVLIAWGKDGPFLPAAASTAPPFGLFRSPHRYLYVAVPALALLAADGLTELARERTAEERQRLGRLLLGLGVAIAGVLGVGFVVASAVGKSEPYRDAYGFGLVVTVLAIWVSHGIVTRPAFRRPLLVIAAVILIGDLWFARHPLMDRNFCDPNGKEVTNSLQCPFPTEPRDKEARALPGVPLDARVYDRRYVKYRPGARLGIRDLGGYEDDPLALSRYETVRATVVGAPALLGHANVRYLLEGGEGVIAKPAADPTAMRELRRGVWELTKVAPAVMWTDRVQIVDGGAGGAMRALREVPPGTTAVLERNTIDRARAEHLVALGGRSPPVGGRLVELTRNTLVAEIDAPAEGVVVIHESYFPGWTATVDGADATILPVNAAFRGIVVGPGHHRIEMRYAATGYVVLAVVSVLAFLGACVLALRERRRERSADTAAATSKPSAAT